MSGAASDSAACHDNLASMPHMENAPIPTMGYDRVLVGFHIALGVVWDIVCKLKTHRHLTEYTWIHKWNG